MRREVETFLWGSPRWERRVLRAGFVGASAVECSLLILSGSNGNGVGDGLTSWLDRVACVLIIVSFFAYCVV